MRIALLFVLAVLGACATDAAAKAPLIPVRIVVYEGYGDSAKVTLRGRVVEDVADPVAAPDRDRAPLANAVRNARMLETDEIKDLPLRLTFLGQHLDTRTDDDGLFEVEVPLEGKGVRPGAVSVEARLHPDVKAYFAPVYRGRVFVFDEGPGVVVLSDFDDTLVEMYARDKRRLLTEVFFKNPAQLTPVPGAPDGLTRALDAGAQGVFILSGSPVALYERISSFLDLHHFPSRTVFLKNLGEESLLAQQGYKIGRLTMLFKRFPNKRFVLVGDSGQKDPEIYAEIRARFPDQVVGIVIRRVDESHDPKSARFANMTVVDDFAHDPDVIARFVRSPMP